MKMIKKEFQEFDSGFCKTTLLTIPFKETIKKKNIIKKKLFGITYKKIILATEAYKEKSFNNHEMKIAFLVGCKDGRSERYYVTDLCDALNRKKISTSCYHGEYSNVLNNIKTFDAIVFFRLNNMYDKTLDKIAEAANKHGIPIIYSIDDLIFDEKEIDNWPTADSFTEQTREKIKSDCLAYQDTIDLCDAAFVSSSFLAKKMEQYIDNVYTFPAYISYSQYEKSLSSTVHNKKDYIDICYLSGTASHNKDFKIAEDALCDILEKYPNVRLNIVGPLELSNKFDNLKNQIKRYDIMHYLDLIEFNSRMDINIAPLEDTNFTKSKTPLKVTESALVKVPTVSSNIPSYSEIISSGVNGYIASNNEEWYKSLQDLIVNTDKRIKMGECAYNTIANNFIIDNNIDIIIETIKKLIQIKKNCSHQKENTLSDKTTVAFLMPAPFGNSGGHRNLFRAISHLDNAGYKVSVYYMDSNIPAFVMKKRCSKWFYDMSRVEFIHYDGNMFPHDIAIATYWTTAYELKAKENLFKKIFYFAQDFEALFYPMSSEYILAENSYRLGFSHICSGPWMHNHIVNKYSTDSDFFQFPVDTSIYNTSISRTKTNKNIIFFAKPEMPRRCYELGIKALKIFHEICPDVEIILFGSKNLAAEYIPFKCTIKSLLPTLNDLATLYRNADLGLVFSTTNPSLVPYEMMACGCPIGDINFYDALKKYGDSEDNVFLLDALPENMAQQLASIINDYKTLQLKAKAGKAFVDREFPSEKQACEKIEKIILSHLM